MAYNQFTIPQLERDFGLRIHRQTGLFSTAPPAPISDLLRLTLAQNSRLALPSGSEKARSEYLIAPILAEVCQQKREQASLFSGIEFDVDDQRGLSGYCDFLFSLTPNALVVSAPVVSVVEAKKENILAGIPQCLAELIAAQIFNAAQKHPIATLYGVVTTGTDWQFLRLQETVATVDTDLYYLTNVEKIVGILLSMLRQDIP